MRLINWTIWILLLEFCTASLSIGFKNKWNEKIILIIGEIPESYDVGRITRRLKKWKRAADKAEKLTFILVGGKTHEPNENSSEEFKDSFLYNSIANPLIKTIKSVYAAEIAEHGIIIYDQPFVLVRNPKYSSTVMKFELGDPIVMDIMPSFKEHVIVATRYRTHLINYIEGGSSSLEVTQTLLGTPIVEDEIEVRAKDDSICNVM